jgi:VCBS repeat-containing protein
MSQLWVQVSFIPEEISYAYGTSAPPYQKITSTVDGQQFAFTPAVGGAGTGPGSYQFIPLSPLTANNPAVPLNVVGSDGSPEVALQLTAISPGPPYGTGPWNDNYQLLFYAQAIGYEIVPNGSPPPTNPSDTATANFKGYILYANGNGLVPTPYTAEISYSPYIWTIGSSLQINPFDKSEAAQVTVTYDPHFNINSPIQTGSIRFTDSDPAAITTTSTIDQEATAHDASGNPITLTDDQMKKLEAAFTIPANTTNGAVNWTYNPDGSALNFLAPAETAVVTKTVQISDQNGANDTATVTVTLQGNPPSDVVAGLDISVYPGDDVMASLRQYTNLGGTGFYLYPAPSHNGPGGSSWMGHLQTLLNQGWLVNPIYVGRQNGDDPDRAGEAFIQNAPLAPADEGVSEAQQAVADMQLAGGSGFPIGTTVYLDIESHDNFVRSAPDLLTYIIAWANEINTLHYTPGIYGFQDTDQDLLLKLPANTSFWVIATRSGDAAPTPYESILKSQTFTAQIALTSRPYTVFPTDDPSTYVGGDGWQYSINNLNYAIPGFGTLATVDFDIFRKFVQPTVPLPPPITNPPEPNFTTADAVMRDGTTGSYEIYNIGNNAILAGYPLGQVGTDWQFVGLGGFYGTDTSDMILRNSGTGAFEFYDIRNNNITNAALLGSVGLDWQFGGFGDFSSRPGETDMILRNSSTAALEVYDISNNSLISAYSMGAVGLNWQVAGFGDFSSRPGETDMIMRNSNTGALEVYDISNNTIMSAYSMGAVGLEWQVAGFGHFSSSPNETDMIMRNSNTGAFEVYDMANNALTNAYSMGAVGLEWQVVGFGNFSGNANETDMIMRNSNTGALEGYNIANNALTTAYPMGAVGLNWEIGGIAPDGPSASTTSMGNSDQAAQLVQAMAGFGGGSGAAENLNAGALGADTSQQPLLTTPQHA